MMGEISCRDQNSFCSWLLQPSYILGVKLGILICESMGTDWLFEPASSGHRVAAFGTFMSKPKLAFVV